MTPEAPAPAGRHTFAGLFATTLATLTYQLLLTRIFSVTMYYHFAFVAISVTMFGMAVGALIVYGRPQVFTAGRVHAHLARAALGFALTIVGSFLAHIWLPFRPELSLYGVASVVLTYAVLSVPFTFSGIVVALALTRFPASGQRAVRRRSRRRRARMRCCSGRCCGHRWPDGDRRDSGDCRLRGGAVFAGRRQPSG